MLYITHQSQTNAQNTAMRAFTIFLGIVLSMSAILGLQTLFTSAQTVPSTSYSPARIGTISYVDSQQAYPFPAISSSTTITQPAAATSAITSNASSSSVTKTTSSPTSGSSNSSNAASSNGDSKSGSNPITQTICKISLGFICIQY